ncbi:MAG: hypothetical protein AB1773_11450 [Pseudomonadota bacterium]
MARKRQNSLPQWGIFAHRRTQADWMAALPDAVPLEDRRDVIAAVVTAAKAGDAGARAWPAQYLIGKLGPAAPAPLTGGAASCRGATRP